MNEGDLIAAAEPFRLDPALCAAPSRFEITFVTDGIVYVYGFAVSRERVESEWLTATKEGSSTKLFQFSRMFNGGTSEDDWKFTDFNSIDEDQIKRRTLGNMLALSVGTQQKVEALRPIYQYLRERVWTVDLFNNPDVLLRSTARRCQSSEDMRTMLSSLLLDADTGMENIHIDNPVRRVPDVESNTTEVQQHLIGLINSLNSVPRITAQRRDSKGNMVEFDFKSDESQGSQRFFAIAGLLLDALARGAFVVVDELDASMHPLLTRRLLELFQSAEANGNGAQLLFTTHDTSLLDQDLFRRDQIWLAEKCDGASTFFSLADIRPPIRNTESFLRNYLTGRYGGTPHLGRAFDDLAAGNKAGSKA